MSNSQRRTAWRQRTKRYPGPHTDAVTERQAEVLAWGRRVHRLNTADRRSEQYAARRALARRVIPVSGPGRRRAKARRNTRGAAFSRYALFHPWIEVDPNIRVEKNLTFSALTDWDPDTGDLPECAEVVAFESEAKIAWRAVVDRIDVEKALVYLAVDWTRENSYAPSLRAGAKLWTRRKIRRLIVSGLDVVTPTQIHLLQDALNAAAGDPAFHHKIIVLPGGSRVEESPDMKEED
jgi:hypothetical protein